MINSLCSEEWREIKGYNGKYLVSSTGKIKNKHGKELHTYKDPHGYLCARLYSDEHIPNSHRVHKLVAETFIPNPEHKRTVCHINGDKLKNEVTNLMWATDNENVNNFKRFGISTDKEDKR